MTNQSYLNNLYQTLCTLFITVMWQPKCSDRYVSVLQGLIVQISPMGDPDNVRLLINPQLSGGLNVLWSAMIHCHSKGHYSLGEWLRLRGDSE